VCRTAGEGFKRKLVHGVAVAGVYFVMMLKSFITNVLKCKTRSKTKFKYASVTMLSLVMSHDFIIS